jgi:hypothetical protein
MLASDFPHFLARKDIPFLPLMSIVEVEQTAKTGCHEINKSSHRL